MRDNVAPMSDPTYVDLRRVTRLETLAGAIEDVGAPGGQGVERFTASPPGEGFLFGGLTMAVGLRAAAQTVGDHLQPKSLHAQFFRPGLWGPALDLDVVRVNDSRSFAVRRVALVQGGKTLAEMVVGFHVPEEGDDRQHAVPPAVPPPPALEQDRTRLAMPGIMEVRPVTPFRPQLREVVHPYWVRFPGGEDHDALDRLVAVTFASDYMVITTPFPRGSAEGARFTSLTLSHTLFFHRPPCSEWLLLSADPLSVSGGRFTSRGAVHDEEGTLAASFVQEGILRPAPTER